MSKGIIICLCDIIGVMVELWVEVGYCVVLVDLQYFEILIDGFVECILVIIFEVMLWLFQIICFENVVIVIGFLLCMDVVVFGFCWFEFKCVKDLYFQGKVVLVVE